MFKLCVKYRFLLPVIISNIEKIYGGIYEDYPLASLNFNALTNICENIKRGISERYGSVDVLPSIKLIFDSINYVLERLRNWISEGNLYKNNDAKIFLRAFESYFNELQEMLAEIDREFAV